MWLPSEGYVMPCRAAQRDESNGNACMFLVVHNAACCSNTGIEFYMGGAQAHISALYKSYIFGKSTFFFGKSARGHGKS